MTKRKTLFKNISIFLCLIPMLILSLFCFIPKNKIKGAYALSDDTVTVNYTFSGSDLIYFNTFLWKGSWSGTYSALYPVAFSLSASTTNGVTTIIPNFREIELSQTSLSYTTLYMFEPIDGAASNSWNLILGSDMQYNTPTVIRFAESRTNYNNKNTYRVIGYVSSDFNANINSVSMYLSNDFMGLSAGFEGQVLYVKYFSVNGSYAQFGFYVPSNFDFPSRAYYFQNPSNFSDSEKYQAGYQDGYNSGLTDGNSAGYTDGYTAGETVGYGNGYTAGLEQSNKYSFYSLIGAVIDAPVSAFTNLLNFELLGVNILGLITGLLSLAIIVFIIKLCMGGR